MRALGATGRRVGLVCAVEAGAVCAVAWLIAAALGLPLAEGSVRVFQRTVMPVDPVVASAALLTMAGATVGLGALAALVPAWRATSLRAVDLLRHE
jgi:ABC-type antimicrobial peptide transport system permease subunit